MKVILPAGEVPVGATVTKPTGTQQYVLKDEVKIYSADLPVPAIKAQGTLFLFSESSITAIPATSEVAWHVDEETLHHWLVRRLEEDK